MIFLRSDRLILRSLCESDAETMFDYRNNILCSRYQRGQLKKLSDIRRLIAVRKREILFEGYNQLFAIESIQTGEMVGEIAFKFEEGTVTVGYTVSYKHHRKGYAYEMMSLMLSELFMRFPDIKVRCLVVKENEASCGLLKKLGFTPLGYNGDIDALVFEKKA